MKRKKKGSEAEDETHKEKSNKQVSKNKEEGTHREWSKSKVATAPEGRMKRRRNHLQSSIILVTGWHGDCTKNEMENIVDEEVLGLMWGD